MQDTSSTKDLGQFVSESSIQCVHHEINRQRERAHGLLCIATPDVRETAGRPVRGSLPTFSLLQRSYPISGFNIYILHVHFLSLACIPVLPRKGKAWKQIRLQPTGACSGVTTSAPPGLLRMFGRCRRQRFCGARQDSQHPAQPSPAILLSWERSAVLHVLALPAKTL